jgi:hypothetical protein
MTGIHCPFQLGYRASAAAAGSIVIVIHGASASAATNVAIALRRELWPAIWSTMMTSLRSGTFQASYRTTGRYDHHPITSFIEITFCRTRWNS